MIIERTPEDVKAALEVAEAKEKAKEKAKKKFPKTFSLLQSKEDSLTVGVVWSYVEYTGDESIATLQVFLYNKANNKNLMVVKLYVNSGHIALNKGLALDHPPLDYDSANAKDNDEEAYFYLDQFISQLP